MRKLLYLFALNFSCIALAADEQAPQELAALIHFCPVDACQRSKESPEKIIEHIIKHHMEYFIIKTGCGSKDLGYMCPFHGCTKRKDSVEKLQSHLLSRHQEDSLSFARELLSLESRKKRDSEEKIVGQQRDKRQKTSDKK
jgi:hypothetical protein